MKITIKAARVNAGLSTSQAANALGITRQTLCNWENGNSFPPVKRIPELASLYGVTMDDINFCPNDKR